MAHYMHVKTLEQFKTDALLLLGKADNGTKEKLIADFMKMNKIENLKSIRHEELVSKLQAYNSYIDNSLMDSVGYFFLCYDNAPNDKIAKAREEVLAQFSYDEYLNIMIHYFTMDEQDKLNRWSNTLREEFEVTRNYECNNLLKMISNMAGGFDKVIIESNPVLDNLGTCISLNVESHIRKSAKDMIHLACITHNEQMCKTISVESKWMGEKYPKFYKADDHALFEFIAGAQFEDLPYNAEALYTATIRTLKFMGSITIPNFDCGTYDISMWSKFDELLGEINREITERIINSPDIEYIDDTKENESPHA